MTIATRDCFSSYITYKQIQKVTLTEISDYDYSKLISANSYTKNIQHELKKLVLKQGFEFE